MSIKSLIDQICKKYPLRKKSCEVLSDKILVDYKYTTDELNTIRSILIFSLNNNININFSILTNKLYCIKLVNKICKDEKLHGQTCHAIINYIYKSNNNVLKSILPTLKNINKNKKKSNIRITDIKNIYIQTQKTKIQEEKKNIIVVDDSSDYNINLVDPFEEEKKNIIVVDDSSDYNINLVDPFEEENINKISSDPFEEDDFDEYIKVLSELPDPFEEDLRHIIIEELYPEIQLKEKINYDKLNELKEKILTQKRFEVNINDFSNKEEYHEFLKMFIDKDITKDNKFVFVNKDGKSGVTLNSNVINSAMYSSEGDDYLLRKVTGKTKTGVIYNIGQSQTHKSGGFFPYLCKLDNDFSKYQIFKEFDEKNYDDNCLYTALANYKNISSEQLNIIKTNIKNRKVAKADLTKIADSMNIVIDLITFKNNINKDGKITNNSWKYGKDKTKPIYKIGFYEDHYFTYDTLNINIDGQKIRTSLYLFKFLIENKEKYLKPISCYDLNEIGYNPDEINDLQYDKNTIIDYNIKYNKKNNDENKYIDVYFADFECYTIQKEKECTICEKNKECLKPKKHKIENKHYPYLLGFCNAIDDKVKIIDRNISIETDKILQKHKLIDKNEKEILEFLDKNGLYTNNYSRFMLDCICLEQIKKEDNRYNNDELYHKDDEFATHLKPNIPFSFNTLKNWAKECTRGKDEKKPIVIYFHNAKYDICFMDFDIISTRSFIKKGTTFYAFKFSYFFAGSIFYFEIRDSYKHLSYPLKDFQLYLGIDVCKDIMPYGSVTEKTVKENPIIKIKDACLELKNHNLDYSKKLKLEFINNVDNIKLNKNGEFDIIKYSIYYLIKDVEVLKKGFMKWRELVMQMTDEFYQDKNKLSQNPDKKGVIDIFNILTTASLVQNYLESNQVYKEIYKINQIPRKFIQKSVYGGRCQSNSNKKYYIEGVPIADFDAIGLYPSAIMRLADYGGILKGLPKIISNDVINSVNELKNMDDIIKLFNKKYDGYFVEIEIQSVKPRQFPLIPVREKNCLNYSNEKIIGQRIVVCKFQLEDIVNFWDCKFKLIRGYYFDEGRDTKLSEEIKRLFYKRKDYKNKKSKIEQVIKLLMNSAYGKTIMKEIETKIDIKSNKIKKEGKLSDYEKYLQLNYDKIKSFSTIADSNKMFIETFVNVNDHYSMPHVGSEILAMSKRIMSEVMCLAEDNNIIIYYQDTDSMHIKEENVKKLNELFVKKYGKDLIGELPGQFHSDFKIDDVNSPLFGAKNIYSDLFIVCGKKAYIDRLTSKDKSQYHEYHMRLKGINPDSIDEYCYKNNITPEKLYKKLYNSRNIDFDLTVDGKKPKFLIKDFHAEVLEEFTRSISFKNVSF